MKPVSVMISLAEASGLLKQSFRDYTSFMLQTQSPRLGQLKGTLDYNVVPYLTQLLDEIFADQGVPEMVGGISVSTSMLIKDGMDRKAASLVALRVFEVVINQISAMLPDITFDSSHGCQYGMCSEFDVMITLPNPAFAEA